MNKYVLISGANNHLGRAAIDVLLNLNFNIFAIDASFNEEFKNSRVIYHTIKASNVNEVSELFKLIKLNTDCLSYVINFTSLIDIVSLIDQDTSILENIFSIGLLGTININNLALPFLKKGHGTIINVVSECQTIRDVPFYLYFSSMREALLTYSKGLRSELELHHVKVTTLNVGPFQTIDNVNIKKQFEEQLKAADLYTRPLKQIEKLLVGEVLLAKPIKKFNKKFNSIVTTEKIKSHYNLGRSTLIKIASFSPSFIQNLLFKILVN